MQTLLRLAVLAIVGCARVDVADSTTPSNIADFSAEEPPRPFARAGEQFVYVGKLLNVPAARLVVGIGDAGTVEGQPALIIRSRGVNELLSMVTELKWELTTTLDLEHGVPLVSVEEAWLVWNGNTDHEREERKWSDEKVHDMHSLLCVMRAWRAKPKEIVKAKFTLGGGTWPLKIWETEREWVGNVPAVRFDGTAWVRQGYDRNFHFSVWISDDADRVPLQIRAETKWGDLTVELVDYEPSGPRVLPPTT